MQLIKQLLALTIINRLCQANTITAYDCTNIQDARLIAYNQEEMCSHVNNDVQHTKMYATILQDTKRNMFKGIRCSVKETRQVYDCGMFSHVTPMAYMMTFNNPVHISPDNCRRAHTEGLYKTRNRLDLKVRKVGTSFINYDEKGGAWASGGEGRCSGERFTADDGAHMASALINIQQQITIEEVTLVKKDGRLFEVKDKTDITCPLDMRHCVVGMDTYAWNPEPIVQCTLARANYIKVTLISQPLQNSQIISADHSMVALNLTTATVRCGHHMWNTNIPDIMVITSKVQSNDTSFTIPLELSIDKVIEYTAEKEHFIKLQMKHFMDASIKKVTQHKCVRDADLATTYPLLSGPPAKTKTMWRVGANMFAQDAGDAYYIFKCSTLKVKPRHADKCYDKLPVKINNDDDIEMFLDIQSKIVSPLANPTPCKDYLHDVVRTNEGHWIANSQRPSIVRSPTVLRDDDDFWANEDSIAGGLFGAEEIAEAQHLLNIEQLKEALPTGLTTTILSQLDKTKVTMASDWVKAKEVIGKAADSLVHPIWTWIKDIMVMIAIAAGVVILIGIIIMIVYMSITSACYKALCCCGNKGRRRQHDEPSAPLPPTVQFTRAPEQVTFWNQHPGIGGFTNPVTPMMTAEELTKPIIRNPSKQ